jgi:signal transduction histidine kinase
MPSRDEPPFPSSQSVELLGTVDDAVHLRRELTRLTALDKVKSDFLDLVSHELRGPLGVALGYVSMLADGTLGEIDARAAVVLPVVLDKLEEMSHLVDQMLLTARLEDSRLHLDRRPIDVRRLAGDACALTQQRSECGGRAIVLDDAAGDLTCSVDSSRIVTVLTNLLDNAVKYSPEGEEVRCTLRRQGAMAAVEVSDHGVGIAQGDQPRLFTRFGRIATTANRSIPGTGLGLYISRELARRHGGDITVASREGEGSTFTLTLPLTGSLTD